MSRLARLVIRIPVGLDETLTDIAGRLFDETELNHPIAAVIRGLVQIGINVVAETPQIAPLFVGVLEPRGRRKGVRRTT